ncbi:NADPH-cytochrome P450 reductase [Thraustotheca clavata]|uniref:NADPH--hemoprotein reductase n=1 Tax=Thraustotheca clavata TaxID=74557 RepID=A0A1W0AB09_9STRA|nr:NADPH-cytochrome P450 reductase [Thraustotheca clavata]
MSILTNLFGSVSLRKVRSSRRNPSVAPMSLREQFSMNRGHHNHSGREVSPQSAMVIYFGSQTGRSEALANRLNQSALKYGYVCAIKDLYKFDPDDFVKESIAIFIVSTYINGGATDNAAHFNFWINAQTEAESAKKNILRAQQYAVFASGDSKYADTFNQFGIAIDNKMHLLGAKRILPCGMGDANTNLDMDYATWEGSLWQAIGTHNLSLSLIENARLSKRRMLPTDTKLQFSVIEVLQPRSIDFGTRLKKQEKAKNHIASNSVFFDAPPLILDSVDYVVSDPKSAVLRVDLTIDDPTKWTYQGADTLVLYPENSLATAEAIATALKFKLSQYVQLIPVANVPFKHPFPSPCTVQDILTKYYECATVSQAVIKNLAQYSKETKDNDLLNQLASDSIMYKTKVSDTKLSLVGLLKLCPSIEISLEVFLHVIPFMQPRYFTIASLHQLALATVSLCIRVPPKEVFNDIEHHGGLIGGYFTDLSIKKEKAIAYAQKSKTSLGTTVDTSQHCVQALVFPSKFRVGPADCPMIMIATSSGFAPMRALLQERLVSTSKLQLLIHL